MGDTYCDKSIELFLTFISFSSFWVKNQEGASKQDIEQLLKFKFRRIDNEKVSGSAQGPVGGIMTECGPDLPTERILSEEDAVCRFSLFLAFLVVLFLFLPNTKGKLLM